MNAISTIKKIMEEFGYRTAINEEYSKNGRYLWTDAFAVFNYLELFRQTKNHRYLNNALKLVSQVHEFLGKHRADDARNGWISGLKEEEGVLHPTIGGLRIGKKNNERLANQPIDMEQEWDRDGQYFHYLTKWMQALHCVSIITDDLKYHQWAIELAKTAYAKFTYKNPETRTRQMYWKMSIDLSYPLVKSMGQHDPLDALVTFLLLQPSTSNLTNKETSQHLDIEIKELHSICENMNWETSDTLGIGGLLANACSLSYLIAKKELSGCERLLLQLLTDIAIGLHFFTRTDILQQPAAYRLAFREFGLSIGLHGLKKIRAITTIDKSKFNDQSTIKSKVDELVTYLPLANKIEQFWQLSENQESKTWMDHRDINNIMLATSIAPCTFLFCNSNNDTRF